jgi:glycosyltransferase involved in cell wall biosynthesis
MSPILSICIPTYNRQNSLSKLLNAITKNIEYIQETEEIEIIILNNNSTDDTEKVVEEFQNYLNIKYHKNSTNIGIAPNIARVTDFATGKFAWIIGDDDLLGMNSLSQIITVLKEDITYMGYCLPLLQVKATDKDKVVQLKKSDKVYSTKTISIGNEKNDYIWEELLLKSQDYHLFTSIPSMIFNREIYTRIKNETIKNKRNESFTSIQNTFPHLVVWGKMFLGKKVYVIRNVNIYFFIGEQEWIGEKKVNWLKLLFKFYVPFLEEIKNKSQYAKELVLYKRKILVNKNDLMVIIDQKLYILFFRYIFLKNVPNYKFYSRLFYKHLQRTFNLI